MSFRRYGGMSYSSKNNLVSSNFNTSTNLLVTNKVGQLKSIINFESGGNLVDGNLTIFGSQYILGDLDICGNFIVRGNTEFQQSLNVYGVGKFGNIKDQFGNYLNIAGNNLSLLGVSDAFGANPIDSGQIFIAGNTDPNKRFGFMLDTTKNIGKIQSGFVNTQNTNNNLPYALSLNPVGGNVGINIEDPSYNLDVSGNAMFRNNLLVNNNILLNNQNGSLIFNSTDTSGNIGNIYFSKINNSPFLNVIGEEDMGLLFSAEKMEILFLNRMEPKC